MNKIFKVVWSKTKECYVVVSEVAKNNGGKKKVLASVLAGLAMVGMGATVQAADMNTDTSANTKNQINIWANTATKGNTAAGGSGASGSGVANANDVKPSQYGDEISIAIGGQNSINTTDTTSPGSGGSGYAIGNKNKIKGNRNVALGTENKTYGDDSIAIGNKTVSGTGHGIAIGTIDGTTQTVAYGNANPSETASSAFGFALAIGSGAQADGRDNKASGGIAIGQLVKSTNNNTVAIGVHTTASGNNAVAIGSGAQATQRISTAYGPNANANSTGGVAIGTDAVVGTDTGLTTVIVGATAVGANAQAQSTNGSAFGRNAKADKNAENATALGAYATANIAGGVALGSESKTTKDAGEIGYNPATGRTNDYKKLTNNTKAALTSTRAAVSIGDDSANVTRQLTGLAAGTQDTDAVNVAQLKAVNLKFAGDSTQVTGSTDVRLNDGTFNVNGDGTLISTEATTTGIKVKAKVGGTITNDPSNDGKAKAPTTDGIATTTNVTDAINNSGWKVTSSNNGGTTNGTSVEKVSPGDKVTFSAGKNIVLDQNGKQFTYSLSDTVALTNTGSLTVGGTKVNNGGVTITAPTGGSTTNVTLTQSGLDNGGNKIVNVKDGDVSATSKDAVNGSQLHAVAAKERHIAPTTASHAAYTVDNNGDVTLDYVDGDGNATSEKAVIKGVANRDLSNISNAGETKIKNLAKSAINMEDGKNTKASKRDVNGVDTYKVDVEGDLTGISSITNGGTNNGKISFGPNKTVTVDGDHSITLNASTGKIGGLQNLTFDPTNFTSGQAATEDQLKSVHDTLKASELHIAPTESNRTGEHIAGAATSNTAAGAAANAYKYDATTKQVVLEYNDGTGANKTGTKAVIDFSALNTGGTTASTWTAKTSAENTTAGSEVGKHAGDTSQVIGNQNSVDFQAGKNMTVKQTNDGNGNTTINYALDKNLDVESVHVGKDGKDGKIGIDGKDGVDGLDGTNRVDIHVEKGAKGVDGTDGHDGVNGHNGKDGMTRIVYEDKGGKQEVATLNDGMKYAGDDAQGTDKTKVIAKKLNETLDIIGGANKADLTTDNIGVNNDGNGKLLVQLSKNLKGINTIKNGNTTITLNDTPSTTTPAVTITGGNLSLGDGTTNNKIVNVAPGTDDTDAVNVKQLKDAKTVLADGKNTKKSGTGTAADPYKVNVEGDLTEITSITNKADASGNAGKITFSPNQTVTVSGDHNISLNGKTGDITGLTNTTIPTTAGSDFATKGRAATEEQLKIVNDKFNNKINLGADGNTETTKLALDNNGGIKFNIKGDGSGASGANQYISTTASGSDIKVDLTQAAKDKLNKTYDVTSTDSSVQVKSTTTNGVTTFDLKVAPAAGTTSTWDIKSSADTANGGATATGHETAAKTIANAKTVEMIAGKNLTVKQTSDTNGAKVEFALSDEIAVGKDGANGVDGKIGVNGKDGASVVINGKDGSIGLTGPRGATGAPGASATLKVKDGVPGVDGAPGTNLTRIVYTDKNNVEHEVATHDDGMKFAGDDGQTNQATNANVIKKHLNNVVDIIGGATKADLTTNNIGVNNDGNDKLLVQLSKNLNGINTVKNGNTTITLNDAPGGATNTPAVTISGGNLSMGDGTHNNKIVNVAPGTDDSDAVNYKQLKAAKTEVKAGKNVVVTSETSTTDGHTTYTVNASTPAVYTKPDGTKLVKQPDGTFKEENGTVYNGPVIASFEDGTGATTGGNMIVNNVGSAINNHATPGVTSPTYLDKLDAAAGDNNTKNAAVNVTDLKNTADALKSNELHIRPTTSGRTGETVNKNTAGTAESYKYDAATKSVTLKYNDGTGAGVTGTEAKIDLSGLADQITSGYTFSTNAKGNLADGTTATATAVGNGKTVSFAAGKNLTVEQNIDATTGEHTYTYALSDKITAGKDGVNGKDGSVGVTGKDGSSVVINGADGSIGMTGPKGQDGKDGINGRDGANLSMTSAKGEQVLVNRDPAHNADTDKAERIVYVPKDASGNPIQDANGKNIVREVATMDDGLKFTGNNESTENKHKLGSLVKVQGEGVTENTTTNKLEANGEEFKSASGNIAVVADSIDKLTVKLNKNLAGINKISNGGSSITLNDTPNATTPAVTITGGNLSLGDGTTNNKIVNVAPGTDDSDAVNYKQLKDAKTVLADGKNTKKSGTGTAADPYKVNVEGDLTEITSITNKADASGNAGKITFSPNQTVTVNGDHNITLDAGSGHIGGLTNLTFNPNSYTSGQAATEDQLKSVHDTLKANERHIAPTTVATGSTETKGGTVNAAGTANVYKYDAASKTVTLTYNDGNGHAVTDTKAVIDLSNLSTGGTGASSWNVKSSANTTDGGAVDANHNANAQNIADGKSVEFQSGKNLVVKQTNDTTNGNATVEFSLSDNITVGKDGANGKDGSVGAKGADGSAVVMNGKDGSIGLNGTNGANGISIKGKDGANGVGIDGKDGVTRIVYTEKVPDPANPGTTKEVTHEVATMDDGLKFTGNNTSTENKQKLGSLVKVQGEGTKESTAVDPATGKKYVVLSDGTTKFESAKDNIAVEADGTDTLTVKLNKNLKGLNSIQLGGNTIQSNGDNITFTTNGGNTKTVATTDQLWTIQANGTDVPAKAGKVNLVAGDHITITPDATNGKMTISATGFGTMNGFDVTANNGATSKTITDGKKVDFNAGSNLTVEQTSDATGTHIKYALKEAVDLGTNGSLKTGDTTINNDGFKNGNTTVGGNGMTINNPTDPTKTVSLTKDGLNNGGNQITNVASGGNVDTNAANIGDIKRLAKDTRIKDGTYTVDNNGTVELTYVDGAGNQVKDASGNAITAKITGLTTLDSTRVKVAVNETGSGKAVGSTTPVKVTKGTEFVAGDNLIVERKAHTGNDLDNSVVYSLNSNLTGINSISNTATGPKMTFGGNSINVTNGDLNMGGNKITNLGKGTATTDAATVGQLTKVTSNNHSVVINKTTDANGAPVYDLAVTGTPGAPAADPRVDMLGEEIGRVGAQGAALSALKPIQYDPLEPTQIMAGYGNYRGNSAVALGVAHYKNESTLIHGGVSWAGGSSHMMANAGVTWKVGNRDSEAAVADRYRKGPISSAYAMQQEMAAMKAQNAGLKGEVSDLKAENEQMKAQIAAMMAKLGL